MVGPREGVQRVVFGARVPEGIAARSPALSRSELLTRLTTLADDTRLRILELLAEEGEQNATAIGEKLGLSQSSASRHLRQLCATNYLTERRFQGAKHYRLNQDRIDVTFYALKDILQKR
jgi:ArsR family transcriptional regulator